MLTKPLSTRHYKTLALKTDNKHYGFRQNKDHVTLLPCTNQKGNYKLFSLQKQIHKKYISADIFCACAPTNIGGFIWRATFI